MAGTPSVYRLPRQVRIRRPGRRPRLRSRDARHLSFGMDMVTGTVTVVLSGELDLTVVPSLAAHLEQVLARKPRSLVFDMTRAGFLDCAAARLIAGTRESLPGGRRPVLRRPGPEVGRVLELTGLASDCEIRGVSERPDRFTMP